MPKRSILEGYNPASHSMYDDYRLPVAHHKKKWEGGGALYNTTRKYTPHRQIQRKKLKPTKENRESKKKKGRWNKSDAWHGWLEKPPLVFYTWFVYPLFSSSSFWFCQRDESRSSIVYTIIYRDKRIFKLFFGLAPQFFRIYPHRKSQKQNTSARSTGH